MRKIYFAVVLYALSMGGILWLMLAQISASTPPEQTRTKYEIGIFEELTQTYTTPPNYTNYQTGQTFTDTNGYRDNLPVWGGNMW